MPNNATRRQVLRRFSIIGIPVVAGCSGVPGMSTDAGITQSDLVQSISLDHQRQSADADAPRNVPIEVLDGQWGRGSSVHLTGAVATSGCTNPVIDSVDVDPDTGTNNPPRLIVTIDGASDDGSTCDRETTGWRYDLYLTDANDLEHPAPTVRVIEAPDNQQAEFGFATYQ